MTQSRDEWRWTDEQGVQRLVRTEELRAAIASQVLPDSVLVWREGMDGWLPASTVPELASAARPIPEPRFGGTIPDGAPIQDKRPPMATLLGMNGPSSRDGARLAAQNAPIVVPSGGGAEDSQGRSPITLRPEYSGAAFDNAAHAVPKPPLVPTEPAPAKARAVEMPKPPPVRGPATSAIDDDWAAGDDEATNVTDRAPLLAAAAAKEAAKAEAARAEAAKAEIVKPAPVAATLQKPALVTPRAEGPVRPAAVAVPGKTPAQPAAVAPSQERTMTSTALKTSLGLGPKAALKAEGSAVSPAPSKVLPKVAPKPAAEASGRHLPPPVRTDAFPKSSLDKPSSLSRPLVAPKPGNAPRTPIPPPPAKDKPSTAPPPPAAEEATSPAAATATADATASAAAAATASAPAAASAAATGESSASLAQALPPPPPMREPSTTAILPPHLTGGHVELRERKPHEVSTTVLIQGLLANTTTEPLPHAPEDPTTGGTQKRQNSGLPSDAGTEYPPISSLLHAQMQPPGPGPQAAQEPIAMPPPRAPSPSRLASTVQGARVATPPPPASSVPMRALVVSGGMLITMVIGSFFVGRCSVKPTGGHHEARAVLANELRAIREAMPAPPKPCWVAKQPVRWAPAVSNRIPFELLPMPTGNVAIGYAKSPDEAVGVEVTPQSGQVNEVFADKPSRGEIERVSPTGADKQFFIATTEPAGTLKSVVQVPAASPFFLGLAEGNIATADTAEGAARALWPLAGETLDAARVVVAGDRGYALTFRRDGAIHGGWIGADRKPSGELVKVVGSGGSVGKPLGGFNGREIAIIFADRADESSPWKMRLGHAPAGTIPASTEVFEMPPGGPGGDAFAPGITGLPDGRWLLIWTEGSAGSRAIRVQTLGPDFAPVGDPIALSPPAGNFGQGVLGVAGAYVTAVFLQKGKSSYELWGGVLQCG